MSNPTHRSQASELAIVMGEAMEGIAFSTGSVAHLYKNLELGPNVGAFRIDGSKYNKKFEPLVKSSPSQPD